MATTQIDERCVSDHVFTCWCLLTRFRNDKTASKSIADSFIYGRTHDVEIFFHLHSEAQITDTEGRGFEVQWRDRRVIFTNPPESVRCEAFRAHEKPILGWYSTLQRETIAVDPRFSAAI